MIPLQIERLNHLVRFITSMDVLGLKLGLTCMKKSISKLLLPLVVGVLGFSHSASATVVEVSVSNLFADNGLALTPVWLGFHDGTFDSFDVGGSASSSLESLAEDGNAAGITADFATSHAAGQQGLLTSGGMPPVFLPGQSNSTQFDIDATNSGYFSFLSMLIPSNDGFIGNDDPLAYSLFDALGNFNALEILVLGSGVYDAGTEANTGFGSPFLVGADAQGPTSEANLIGAHSGLATLPGGLAIFGGQTPVGYTIDQAAADFTAQGFQVARISITQVSEPGMAGLFALGLIGMMRVNRRKVKNIN